MVKIEVAEPKDRFVAAAIDFVPPFLLFLLFAVLGADGLATLTAVLGAVYLVARDLLGNGQSFGKRFRNLQVVDADTDRVPDAASLLLRNLGFLVPGLNVVYAIVEGVQVVRHPQGLRYGDMFAQTGVVKVPKEERERLLVKPVERRSRDSMPKVESTEPEGAAATSAGAVPSAPSSRPSGSGAVPSAPSSRPSASSKPSGSGMVPQAAFDPPSTRPAPLPIDLPPDAAPAAVAKPAGPPPVGTPPPPKPAAAPVAAPLPPIPGSDGGIAMSDDDPLKKLIEKAGGSKT